MKQWLNPERTLLVRQWPDGTMEVATRLDPACVWGPPITVEPDEDPRHEQDTTNGR